MLDSALDSIQEHDSTLIQLAQQKNKSKRTRMEWIVVSDGSTDKTADVVKRYAATTKARHTWKLVTLHTNSGKGAAVQAGMLHASRQSLKLMVDADGATDFGALLTLLEKSHPVVFGSRAHLESQVKRSFVRNLLMHAFHICVDLLVGSTIRDTQCGFKLFEADAAHILFNTQHLRRWAFDIELVVLCAQLGLEICEVGVPWHEVEGSKLDSTKLQLALVAIGMLRDMLCVRLCYSVGLWRVKAEKVHK
jgi:dolichyl-phosphate beta-glucosyltransferase